MFVFTMNSLALATTWIVDGNGGGDFLRIQPAVNNASDGDEIIVMPGTYTRNSNPVVDIWNKSLWIHSSDGPEVTIISGEGVRQCMFLAYSDSTIEGFTIQDGVDSIVGGMYVFASDATITDCVFVNNEGESQSAGDAGALSTSGLANVQISDSNFINNTSEKTGAIFISGTSSLTNCQISGNTGGTYSGGLTMMSGNVSLNQCTIQSNDGGLHYGGGGGIWVYAGGVYTIIDGVWIYLDSSELTMTDCNVSQNTTPSDADNGILLSLGAQLHMYGDNVIDDAHIENSGTTASFQAGSVCEMSGSYSPTDQTATVLDVDAFDAEALLKIEGTLFNRGCLSITNLSNSLADSQVGDEITIFEFGQTDGQATGVVFPAMPDGLGLQFIFGPINGGSDTRVKLKVIETEQASFSDPIPADLSSVAIDISAFDADGDGEDELAILYPGTPGEVVVYDVSNDGSPPTEIADFTAFVGNDPVTIDAGDVNGDGLDDLLITNSTDNTLSLLLTQEDSGGNLFFTSSTLSIPGTSQSLTCGAIVNWDGDTDLDAVVGVDIESESTLDKYQVMLDIAAPPAPTIGPSFDIPMYVPDLGSPFPDAPSCVDGHEADAWGFVGGTRFGRVHRTIPGGTLQVIDELEGHNTVIIEVVELDSDGGDGQVDLIVASDQAETIYLFQGNDTESDGFEELIPVAVSEPVKDALAIDADDDGDMDLVFTSPSAETSLVLLRNDGGGSGIVEDLKGITWSKQDMNAGNPLSNIEPIDVNDDKDVDKQAILGAGDEPALRGELAGTMEQTNILLGSDCVADIDGDGEVNVADLLILIGQWGPCSDCDADLDSDGEVNVADLLILIGAWGQCK